MSLAVFLICVMLVASSGALFKPDDWYRALAKPGWTPPDWVFGAGWTLLYVMIAVAGWRVWERAETDALLLPMAVYAVQLVLNAGWSAIFFGLKRMDWAMAEVLCLWAAISVNILAFYPIDPVAAWLLVPYLAWVTFAAALNLAVWRLNRSSL
ncbi:MAG TPA: tryptophan-rich sensory protein [Kiloniellaceae bacterium]|nr:tryptophan-rich sensory protein [Kiloniellaceae bacterium]HIP79099.1 tryptophan-rich sensory protein [Kiloniellaceae bacterium]